ncbi:MAG TPA: class I SAM-dependent methyltransferase [Casimicrobiaceae bacterium]|jgi:SAM-dependent methyltransferase
MSSELKLDQTSFRNMEYAGWEKNASSYDELFGSVTRHAIEPLLDATAVQSGSNVLEVCCGPGYGVAAALARGARAIGVDFAPAMVEAAKRLFPVAHFEQGDAEALRFEACVFDAVICAFGVNHLQDPDRAIAEMYRVLRPGGNFAFTMWCVPEKSKFHQLVLESIRSHGTLDVPLPVAPPPFRFSEPDACTAVLRRAGFADPRVIEIPLSFRPRTVTQVLDLTYSAVRMEMILNLQTAQAREQIHRAIVEGAKRFRIRSEIEVPMPAVLASGEKPWPQR